MKQTRQYLDYITDGQINLDLIYDEYKICLTWLRIQDLLNLYPELTDDDLKTLNIRYMTETQTTKE